VLVLFENFLVLFLLVSDKFFSCLLFPAKDHHPFVTFSETVMLFSNDFWVFILLVVSNKT